METEHPTLDSIEEMYTEIEDILGQIDQGANCYSTHDLSSLSTSIKDILMIHGHTFVIRPVDGPIDVHCIARWRFL